MSEKKELTQKEISAKMLSEVLHEVAPQKYPKDYITAENYDLKKQEVAEIFTKEGDY